MLSIVLSRKDFREFDQIISVYNEEKGKISLVVRGVKKIVSKNSAHLEPFSLVNIDIEKGKEFDYLTRVYIEDYFKGIRQNLDKSLVASFVIYLVDKLFSEGAGDERFFYFLHNFFVYLDNLEKIEKKEIILLIDFFVVNLLYFLGFKLSNDEKVFNSRYLDDIIRLENSSYENLFNIDFELYLAKKTHNFLHNLLQFHTEKRIADWAQTCII
ncbi:MAG: DNA repair protein RecO [Candidatus Magasanikbacteria bacterium]